jgi:hypothetical protein
MSEPIATPTPVTTPVAAPSAPTPAPVVPSTTPPPAAAPANDWTGGFNDDLKGYVGTKGFKDPAALADSYRQLEKLVGVKDKLIKIPDAADSPEWDAIHERLGRPKTAAEYKIDAIPNDAKSAEFTQWAKDTFHGANLTSAQAEKVMGKFGELQAANAAKDAAAGLAQNAHAETEMKTMWGNAYEQNINIAKAAAKQFGDDPTVISGIEKTLGTVKTMEFFHKLGQGLGEATFTTGAGKGGGQVDPSTAKAQINQLKGDTSFAKKLASGDAQARAQWDKAFKDAYPGETSI